MRYSIVLWLVASMLAIGADQAPPATRHGTIDAQFLLRADAAGVIELGQTIDQVYARVGRDNTRLVDLFTEGMFSPALEIRLPDATTQPAIVTPIREWPCAEFSVWGIMVRDSRFRTADGFGVGSRLGDLRRMYKTEISQAEGRSAHVAQLGLTFMLDDRTGGEDSWRVKSVWVVPQPVRVRQTRCPQLGPLGAAARDWRH
jgi:hypothetical protein